MNTPRMFDAIAPCYDLLNRVLSFGMDSSWRRRMLCHLPAGEGLRVLDLATGTGDVALLLAGGCPRVREVVGIDLSEKMLKIARDKTVKAGFSSRISFEKADARNLPFEAKVFDAVTVAFGLRNFSDLMQGMAEARRVLRDNGRLIILEFGQPDTPAFRQGHGLYLRFVMPVIAFLLTGQGRPYRYLGRTVRKFPYGRRFARIVRQVGFRGVRMEKILQGTAMIYEAWT